MSLDKSVFHFKISKSYPKGFPWLYMTSKSIRVECKRLSEQVRGDRCLPLRLEKFPKCFSSFGVNINSRGGQLFLTFAESVHPALIWGQGLSQSMCVYMCLCVLMLPSYSKAKEVRSLLLLNSSDHSNLSDDKQTRPHFKCLLIIFNLLC